MTALAALWCSVLLGGIAQIALKLAVGSGPATGVPRSGRWWFALLGSGWLWLYFGCFAAATALWLLALSGLSISYAFPLLSASYLLVAVLARVILRETVSFNRWLSISIICLGVILIAQS
jgi:drug/metabolite transporter (DMT)-like permease